MKKRLNITDPMALVQLSERLHLAEIALGNMLKILYELASRTPEVMKEVGTLEVIPGIFTPPILYDDTLEGISEIITQPQTKLNYDYLEDIDEIMLPTLNQRLNFPVPYDYKLNEVKAILDLVSTQTYNRLG